MPIQEAGSGLQSPAVVLSQQGSPGGGRVVLTGCVCILQWGEFLLSRYFKGNEVPGREKGSSSCIPASCSALDRQGEARFAQMGTCSCEGGGLGGFHSHRKNLTFLRS